MYSERNTKRVKLCTSKHNKNGFSFNCRKMHKIRQKTFLLNFFFKYKKLQKRFCDQIHRKLLKSKNTIPYPIP